MSGMTTTEFEALLGPGSMADFETLPESEQSRLRAWVARLPEASDDELIGICVKTSTEVVISESERRTAHEPYIKNRAAMNEARRRHVAAGHDSRCPGPNLYTEAVARTERSFGFTPSTPHVCACKSLAAGSKH